uniref:Uncharacterized protein n=1 Tax=Anguilla anguilla TaxID=7936 RepID=A0A0E9VWM7_ANGAN
MHSDKGFLYGTRNIYFFFYTHYLLAMWDGCWLQCVA